MVRHGILVQSRARWSIRAGPLGGAQSTGGWQVIASCRVSLTCLSVARIAARSSASSASDFAIRKLTSPSNAVVYRGNTTVSISKTQRQQQKQQHSLHSSYIHLGDNITHSSKYFARLGSSKGGTYTTVSRGTIVNRTKSCYK